jgi:hypothetical protein
MKKAGNSAGNYNEKISVFRSRDAPLSFLAGRIDKNFHDLSVECDAKIHNFQ